MNRLEEIVSRLAAHGVEFVIVDGFAAAAHGSSLLTRDVDVAFRFTEENLGCLHAALADLRPRHRMRPDRPEWIPDPVDSHRFRNLYLETDGGQLDCLGDIPGVGDIEAVMAGSEIVGLNCGPVRILTLDALIRSKEALREPKDQQQLLQLRAIRERLRGPEPPRGE